MDNGSTAYGRLFQNRSFLALWLGQTISFVGDYFYWLAVPIMVGKLTGSATQVGLSVIASALPMLLLGPVAGVFVDRWDRKRTMIMSDLLRGVLVLICLTVKTPEQVWIYYVVAFLMSCVSRFFFPAQNAALPLIVPDKNDLLAANGLMQVVQTAGFLVGPALAGFSIGLWGEQIAFLVDSATFFISADKAPQPPVKNLGLSGQSCVRAWFTCSAAGSWWGFCSAWPWCNWASGP
jgi:DHA3 family macrolide efflux protein-like MFS transporter